MTMASAAGAGTTATPQVGTSADPRYVIRIKIRVCLLVRANWTVFDAS